jgi:hypothetical protein
MSLELSISFPTTRIGGNPAPLAGDARALVDSLVRELAGEKIDLPSFPDVAMRVRKALTNEDVGIDDAVKIVSAEPALSARLMQLANSATLNPGGKSRLRCRSCAGPRRTRASSPGSPRSGTKRRTSRR